MTDVDGTITSSDDSITPVIYELVRDLDSLGITMGLVSGRSLPSLERLAHSLEIGGPIIGEHGGVAKLHVDQGYLELGYSQEASLKALNKLQRLYPNRVRGLPYNNNRLVDIVFEADGMSVKELSNHLNEIDLVDSGYMLHLLPEGVNKGTTLKRLLGISGKLMPTEVMVIGDYITDLSLFEHFSLSVLVANPKLPREQRHLLEATARFGSDQPYSDGFIEVINHLLMLLSGKKVDYHG
jgi:hydroxymethylpyrimidine pyrophosphatase-like HAD family hydrolase